MNFITMTEKYPISLTVHAISFKYFDRFVILYKLFYVYGSLVQF